MKMVVSIQRSIASVAGFQAGSPEEPLSSNEISLEVHQDEKFEEYQFQKGIFR